MRRILKIAATALAIGLVVIQFVQPDRTNPTVNAADTIEASASLPDDVRAVLARSCSDCHSNTTNYPWYAKISPVSWWLNNHINEGRSELNLSVYNTYSDRKKAKKLEEICEQVETRAMPLPSYLLIHTTAKLSDQDIATLCTWTKDRLGAIQTEK